MTSGNKKTRQTFLSGGRKIRPTRNRARLMKKPDQGVNRSRLSESAFALPLLRMTARALYCAFPLATGSRLSVGAQSSSPVGFDLCPLRLRHGMNYHDCDCLCQHVCNIFYHSRSKPQCNRRKKTALEAVLSVRRDSVTNGSPLIPDPLTCACSLVSVLQ